MIAVDTNIISYLLISGERTPQVKAALRKDPEWVVPLLWRSEFRSVLAQYLHRGFVTVDWALQIMREAELLMQGGEYQVTSPQVLSLSASSRCSAYDCEFVALAQTLGVPLVTSDRAILAAFPSTAVSLEEFSA